MIRLLLLLLSFSQIALATDNTLSLSVVEVYDGDTIKTTLDALPSPLNKVSIRIYGIDTPEKPAKSFPTSGKLGRSKCAKEANLSIEATKYLKELVKAHGNEIIIKDFKWGKYGGRIVAKVFLYDLNNNTKINIANAMIENGYAVEYFGGRKTKNWCE